MKKFILGVIVGACVMMAVDYCSTTHVAKDTPQQPKKGEMITWMKLDTLIYDNPKFMAVYPNYFKVDSLSGDSNVKLFTYSEDEDTIRLRCFAVGNSSQWNTEATADSIVSIRKFLGIDSLTMKDMHPGYFYLEGFSRVAPYSFYEQFVVDKDYIYVYELNYTSGLKDRVKKLKELVHNWNPY